MSTNPVILRTPITRKVQDLNGNAISGATATITVSPGTTLATVYSAETGAGTISQSLISNADGSEQQLLAIMLTTPNSLFFKVIVLTMKTFKLEMMEIQNLV
jgi:hypothetical protein